MLLSDKKIEEIERVVRSIIRVGIVVATYPDKGTVRVKIEDQDGITTHELPVIFSKTLKDKDFWMVDRGEQVVCIFLPYSPEVGFVVGAIYSNKDPVVCADQDKKCVTFEDGTVIEYHRKKHLLLADVKGDVVVKAAGEVKVVAKKVIFDTVCMEIVSAEGNRVDGLIKGNLRLEGRLDVDGDIHATGTIIDEGGNTNHHSH